MNSKTTKVLIMEHPYQAEFLERILKNSDSNEFEMVKRSDFYQIIKELNNSHFDALLMSMGLESQNLDVLQQMTIQYPDLPVVIIVAKFDENLAIQLFEFGAQDYLVKGEFTAKILERTILNSIKKEELKLKIRKQAEDIVDGKIDGKIDGKMADGLAAALHELRVSRFELEIQNEELRKTWVELEDSRSKYQDLYDFAPLGYLTLNEKGVILDANITAAALLKVQRKNFINRAFILYLNQDSRRKLHKHLNSVLKTKTRQICQLTIKRKDGTVFEGQLETLPLHHDDGEFKEFRTVLSDITEQKKTELSIARLAALVKSSDDAIVGMDFNGKILSWNSGAEKMYGYAAEEIIGRSLDRLIPPSDNYKMIAVLNAVKNGETVKNYETKRLKKDGEEIIVALTVSPILDTAGKIVAASTIARDISQIKQTEGELEEYRKNLEGQVKDRTEDLEKANERLRKVISKHEQSEIKLAQLVIELKRSNKELEQFAYVASHDLQEPLRMVSSFTQLLERQYNDKLDADAHEYIKYAVDGAKRMQMLINDLLAYSRVTSRGESFVEVDLMDVVDESLFNLEIAIEENGADIVVDPLPHISADRSQIVQLFQNLLGNAIKYRSEEPPRIRISAEKNEKEWVFQVKDNGIGIEPDYHERIFQIFQRLHESHIYSGTGIGLAICKKIVERHGGRIWVDSKLGEGSTFYFTIPMDGKKNDRL